MQVVRRVQERQDVREAVPGEPQQLLLTAHLAVIAGEPAGALRRRQPARDHPCEVARLEALRPATLHAALASAECSASSRRTARTAASTSWTRTIAAPRSTPP